VEELSSIHIILLVVDSKTYSFFCETKKGVFFQVHFFLCVFAILRA
jgi:hypothetical protein